MIGWAQDTTAPDTPVSLVVTVEGRVVGRALADRPRDDLVREGIGHGRYGFDFAFPEGAVPALTRCTVAVRREGDGAVLPGSPRALDPVTTFDEDLQARLSHALAAPVEAAEAERRLSFLRDHALRLRQARAGRHGERAVALDRPRALVIDATVPATGRDAGSNAILSHMRSLRRLGYAVSFVPVDLRGDAAPLEAEGITCHLHPWYATVEEVLRRNTRAFALVYLHRVDTAGRYSQLVRDTQRGARLVYSVADLHHLRTSRQAEVEGRADLAAYAEHLRFLELTAARAADAVITHSTHEAALLRGHVASERVHVVPWAVAPSPVERPFEMRRGSAFIGTYAHRPNVDAARFLIEAVMPEVRALWADIPCLLAGSGIPDSVRTLAAAQPEVEALGHVPDIAALFDRVRLTIAPLTYGAGVKGKVLDSLAAGVPCVCTPAAAEGIDLPEPLAALVEETPAGLAKSIVALHGDEALNRACAEAGLRYVSERLSEARVDAAMRAAVGLPAPADPMLGPP